MNIAIIGSGISGLTAAYILRRRHQITLFEAANYCGGHSNTIMIKEGNRKLAIDTGFIVFNELNYPNLVRLFDQLGVASQPSEMSFSVHCDQSGLEYNGSTLSTLFAQHRNLAKPAFWRLLQDILAFHRHALAALSDGLNDTTTIGEFVRQRRYGRLFFSHYLQPMGASIWSCPGTRFDDFPARFVIEFMANHRLLQVNDQPEWRTVVGGSCQYVKSITRPFADQIQLQSPVRRISRQRQGVSLTLDNRISAVFDHVIIATHADQALAMLADPDDTERELLSLFPYQFNEAVLHSDCQLLPQSRRAWASWNYRLPKPQPEQVTLTYNMNILQNLTAQNTYCVTLNQTKQIDPQRIIRRIGYHHPRFGPGLLAAQSRHAEMIQRQRLSYCGAYWGHGFHEDGLTSALRVCEAFDLSLSE